MPTSDSPVSEQDALATRVRRLAEEAVAETDLYVVKAHVRGWTGSRVVEVSLDADDGAGLDEIAEVSRSLSFLLDTEDFIDGKYRLEVSSPGADEPLHLPRQFPQHVGRELRVRYRDGKDSLTVTGTLIEASGGPDGTITLEVPSGDTVEIPHENLDEARVELPW